MPSTILIRYAEGAENEVFIKWEEDELTGEWIAWRPGEVGVECFGSETPSYRLYDLDAIDLTGVMAVTQQVMRGDLPRVYLEPRESDIRRKLNLS